MQKVQTYEESFNQELFESAQKNPMKGMFAFQVDVLHRSMTENFLLNKRRGQDKGVAFVDRTFHEHWRVFGEAQIQLGRMDSEQQVAYHKIAEKFEREIIIPDVYVNLFADIEILQERITFRGREQEIGLVNDASYLELIEQLRVDLLKKVNAPVININTNTIKLAYLDSFYLNETFSYLATQMSEMNVFERFKHNL